MFIAHFMYTSMSWLFKNTIEAIERYISDTKLLRIKAIKNDLECKSKVEYNTWRSKLNS